MAKLSSAALEKALEALGLPEKATTDPDLQEHMDVLGECMAIYFVRNQKYKNSWEQYGAMSQLVRAANKIDRLMAVWWFDTHEGDRPPLTQEDADDAIDAINHLVFFLRCVMAGNLMGSQAQRPEIDDSPATHYVSDVLQFPGMP